MSEKFAREFIYTIPESVLFDPDMHLVDLKIYMIVRSFMDTTKDAYPTNGWISEKLNIHKITASKSISKMVGKKYLERFTDSQGYRHLRIVMHSLREDSLTNSSGVSAEAKGGKPVGIGGVSVEVNQLDQRDITSKNINTMCESSLCEPSHQGSHQQLTKNELQSIFDRLWQDYPLKKGKQKAVTAFLKETKGKTPPEIEDLAKRIYAGIWSMRQEHSWLAEIKEREGWDVFIPSYPNGATWFANRRWTDEYETDRAKFLENIRVQQKYRRGKI